MRTPFWTGARTRRCHCQVVDGYGREPHAHSASVPVKLMPKTIDGVSDNPCCDAGKTSLTSIDLDRAPQGERRLTPSLMNTRNGVVPEALPSSGLPLAVGAEDAALGRHGIELDLVVVDLAAGLGGREVRAAFVADDHGIVLPDHDAAAARAFEGVLQDLPGLVVLLGRGGRDGKRKERCRSECSARRSGRRHGEPHGSGVALGCGASPIRGQQPRGLRPRGHELVSRGAGDAISGRHEARHIRLRRHAGRQPARHLRRHEPCVRRARAARAWPRAKFWALSACRCRRPSPCWRASIPRACRPS